MKEHNLPDNYGSPKNRKKKKRRIRKRHSRTKILRWQFAILLICIPTFLISTFFFCRDFLRYKAEDNANAKLVQKIKQVRSRSEYSHFEPTSKPSPEILAEYTALWEENHDFAGWLFIEDTKIDYPVMYTPDDPEYYLYRAFDGSDARSGCLFADAAYSMDGDSILIYGHNMKDNSMFGSLTDYRSYEFSLEHSVIHFDTLAEKRDYELLAAFYWDVSSVQENVPFLYYKYPDLSSPEVFDEYISNVKEHAIYDTGVTAEYGDKILTLSTCSYHSSNGRFVVVAVSH